MNWRLEYTPIYRPTLLILNMRSNSVVHTPSQRIVFFIRVAQFHRNGWHNSNRNSHSITLRRVNYSKCRIIDRINALK